MANNAASGPARRDRTRAVLLGVAIFELITSLSGLAVLFGEDTDVPGMTPAGLAIGATILLIPLFAIAALVLAWKGQTARAIMAVAGVVLLKWASYLPSLALNWADFPGGGVTGGFEVAQIVLFPLLALAAIVLAWRNERFGLAAGLVAIPTIVDIIGIAAFAVAVIMYGF
jgi:hypothetical protein